MKVKELKHLLEGVDDEMDVVCTGSDHSYIHCDKRGTGIKRADTPARLHSRGRSTPYYMHYGNEHMDESCITVDVFYIDDGRY